MANLVTEIFLFGFEEPAIELLIEYHQPMVPKFSN